MSAEIIDGRAVANRVKARVAAAVERLVGQGQRPPQLTVIRVGDDPGSAIYIRNKHRAAQRVGIDTAERHLSADITAANLNAEIEALNASDDVDGILLQLPLPPHLVPRQHIRTIRPEKDADGFHPTNLGRLVVWDSPLRPCTPAGVMVLLHEYDVSLRGREAVVIGRSLIVGRSMAQLLLKYDATVTICHRHTVDLSKHVRRADVVVSATGVPKLVKGEWIKPGATIIDVGITRLDSGKLQGDVDFETAKEVAGAITPVPGGVGPMTIAMLLNNTVVAARLWRGLPPDPGLNS